MTHVNNILDDLKLPRSEDLQVNLKTIQDVLSNLAQAKEFNLPEKYEWSVSDEYQGLNTPHGLLIYNGYDSISTASSGVRDASISWLAEPVIGNGLKTLAGRLSSSENVFLVTPANIKPVFPSLNVLDNQLKELESLIEWLNKRLVKPKDIFNYLATKDFDKFLNVEVGAQIVKIKMSDHDDFGGYIESDTGLFFDGYPEVDNVRYTIKNTDEEVLDIQGHPILLLGLLNPDYDLNKEVLKPKTIRPGFEIIKEIVPKKVIKGTKFTCGTLRPSIGFEANMSFDDETTKLELKDLTNEMDLSITLHGCRSLFDVFKGLN